MIYIFLWGLIMKEFENFINSSKIEEEYHKKIFNDNLFEKFFSKINLKDFEKLKNEIYWLSLLIFRCSTTNYLDNINKDINTEKSTMTLNINNLIIFHPFGNIASEICKHFIIIMCIYHQFLLYADNS